MKNTTDAAETSPGKVKIITPEGRLKLPKEVQDILGKMERHEILPPKYPNVLKDNLRQGVRKRLQENPCLTLKELVLQTIPILPDWLPPKLFVEAVSWVTEEWQSSKKNQEHLAAAGSGGSGQ